MTEFSIRVKEVVGWMKAVSGHPLRVDGFTLRSLYPTTLSISSNLYFTRVIVALRSLIQSAILKMPGLVRR
jgi:hypothetical protein